MVSETELLTALFAASSGTFQANMAGACPLGGDVQTDPAGQDPGWSRFLALLAAQTGADTAALLLDRITGPERPPDCCWHHGPALPVLPERDRMRSSRVYSQDDLPGLYRRKLVLRALRTPPGPWGCATLVLWRRHGDFRAMDGVQLSSLLPYLGPALATWQALERERRQAGQSHDLLRAMGAGWLVFSPGALVLEMSPDAETILAAAGLRLLTDGRLVFGETSHAASLRKALSEVQQGAPARLLCLSDSPRLEILVRDEGQGAQRRLVGRMRLERMARGLPPDQLARHFGLSRSEARLAQRLCDGLTLKEAATDLGWTLETARSTSKQIYARMDLRGQGDLLRRMQGSTLWTAPAKTGR